MPGGFEKMMNAKKKKQVGSVPKSPVGQQQTAHINPHGRKKQFCLLLFVWISC
jgi:hypothetical protein